MDDFNLSICFNIKPYNEMAKVSFADDESSYANIVFRSKQVLFNIHDSELANSFFECISQEWVQFVIDNSQSYILEEEFVLCLN